MEINHVNRGVHHHHKSTKEIKKSPEYYAIPYAQKAKVKLVTAIMIRDKWYV